MFEAMEFACKLADILEDGAIADGTHLGISDSEFVARALRAFVKLVEDGVIGHEVIGTAR